MAGPDFPIGGLNAWTIFPGDDATYMISDNAADGTPSDLLTELGSTWTASISRYPGGASVSLGIETTNAAIGVLIVSMTDDISAGLTPAATKGSIDPDYVVTVKVTGGSRGTVTYVVIPVVVSYSGSTSGEDESNIVRTADGSSTNIVRLTEGPPGPQGATGLSFVYHGTDAFYPRPDSSYPVAWVGTVRPVNYLNGDLVFYVEAEEPDVDWFAAFNSTDLSGADLTRVSSWLDASGNGHTLVQGTGGLRPYLSVVSGQPQSVYCDGGNGMAVAWASLLAQPVTYIVALRSILPDPVGADDLRVVDGIDSSNRNQIHPQILASTPNRSTIQLHAGAPLYTPGNFDDRTDRWRIMTSCFNGTESFFKLDGQQLQAGDVGAQGTNGMTIGLTYNQVAGHLPSYYYAIRVYDGVLDSDTILKVEAWLAYLLDVQLQAG